MVFGMPALKHSFAAELVGSVAELTGDAAEFSPAEDEESCGAPESLEPASDSLEVGSLEGPLELSSQAVRTDRAESVNAANPTARTFLYEFMMFSIACTELDMEIIYKLFFIFLCDFFDKGR